MNRLQYETSPYLLQHANNPVDWYAWGEEALSTAQEQDKPIFLSIGYSACHWCHVMEHESFDDPRTAEFMNENFINIKVDREERPDIDDIYMQATLIFTGGHGGWPMSVFLTPDGRPIHAGTYFPPTPRHGMPSFMQVMGAVLDAYHNRRDELEGSANRIKAMLQQQNIAGGFDDINQELLDRATKKLTARPDRVFGGLHTGQPKFPSPMSLDYLLRTYATDGDESILEIVTFTLKKMARGGIYDQIGGGFHRYSVDNRWLVPHFEKMLYDNAQLVRVYLHAYQLTGDQFFADVAKDILTYIEREMLDTESRGGYSFYSTQDADSEGEEGKFFVWSEKEIHATLADELTESEIDMVIEYYGITAGGNFEGKNIPNIEDPLEDVADWNELSLAEAHSIISKARQLLFDKRKERIHPGRDEKVLTAWNGMMMAAYAEAARVLGDNEKNPDNHHYHEISVSNAAFIINTMRDGDTYRLRRTYKRDVDEVKLNGYLEDYANVIDGLLELYQTTFDPQWFEHARNFADYVIEHFTHEEGGFYDTSDDHEQLIARLRSVQDNATPSGNNLMAYNLVRLAAYTGNHDYEEHATKLIKSLTSALQEYPSAFGLALWATHFLAHRAQEVAVIGNLENDLTQELLATIRSTFRPTVLVALHEQDVEGDDIQPKLLAHRTMKNDASTVYVCQNFVCANPVNTVKEMEALLNQ